MANAHRPMAHARRSTLLVMWALCVANGVFLLAAQAGPPQPAVQIMVAPAPDLALRRLLVELGMVTEEQLAGIVELSNRLPVLPASAEG